MAENPENSNHGSQNTTETRTNDIRSPGQAEAQHGQGDKRSRANGRVTPCISHRLFSNSTGFSERLCLRGRNVGSEMDYTTLQKLGSPKPLVENGVNTSDSDEFSQWKMDGIQKMTVSSNWQQTENLSTLFSHEYSIQWSQWNSNMGNSRQKTDFKFKAAKQDPQAKYTF